MGQNNVRELKLRYASTCSWCQKPLKKGRKAFRDDETARIACTTCGKLLKRGMQPVIPCSPAQESIDQAKAILALGKMAGAESRAQLEELLRTLRTTYAKERAAQDFFTQLYDVSQNDSLICMSLKHSGKCKGCSAPLSCGEMAVWDKHAHRIWCLDCVVE